jgi:hypothetical protein
MNLKLRKVVDMIKAGFKNARVIIDMLKLKTNS